MTGVSPNSHIFCDWAVTFNFTQIISDPTHICSNILDFVLSNFPNQYYTSQLTLWPAKESLIT